MAPEAPALTALTVSGDLDAWSAAGFAADDEGGLQLGSVRIRTADTPGATGIVAWSLTGIEDGVVDGLLTLPPDATPARASGPAHPNTTTAIDHLVVASPDLDRTTEAFLAIGLGATNVRDVAQHGDRALRIGDRIGSEVGEAGGGLG